MCDRPSDLRSSLGGVRSAITWRVYCHRGFSPMSIATPITSELIFLVEEDPESGYLARAIGESIFTQAETLEELRQVVRDAVDCYCEACDRLRSIVRISIKVQNQIMSIIFKIILR